MAKKAPKPKKINVELIDPEARSRNSMYLMLKGLIEEHHPHLKKAKIALARALPRATGAAAAAGAFGPRALPRHAQQACDKDGKPREDERGRPVWRVRKHDIEEFREVVERHGCYKSDLEAFVKAALEARETPLFPRVAAEA
jgi:hypothetical protein